MFTHLSCVIVAEQNLCDMQQWVCSVLPGAHPASVAKLGLGQPGGGLGPTCTDSFVLRVLSPENT